MRLSEIEKLTVNKDRKHDDFAIYQARLEDAKEIGKLGPLSIRKRAADRSMLIGIVDKTDTVLGIIELRKEGEAWQAWQASYSSLHNSLQGQGIMAHVYKFLIIDYDLTLMSDETQSIGGQSIWTKLFKMPSVNVYAMRKAPGHEAKFSSVSLNDLGDLEGVFDVYYHDDDEKHINTSGRYKELNKAKDAGQLTKAEYLKARDQIERDEINLDKEQQEEELAAYNTFLIATKK